MVEARDRLATARMALEAGFAPAATSLAYYAMLYAARAALSEHDRYAKTHRGTWDLFFEVVVASGAVDEGLASSARRTLPRREASDYDAARIPMEEGRTIVDLAGRFVAAVDELLAG